MEEHAEFTVEELVLNTSFRRWVKERDQTEEKFWLNWIGTDKHRKDKTEEASRLISILGEKDFMDLSDAELRQDIADVMLKVRILKKNQGRSDSSRGWLAAASLAGILMVFGIVLFWNNSKTITTVSESSEREVDAFIRFSNTTTRPLTFLLPDSSLITLEPSASAFFYNNTPNERKIELTGRASFDVRRDPQRPFVVLSNQVVTRVLGTVFKINSTPQTGSVQVEVLSGKVSVFRESDWEDSKKELHKVTSGVVLTANQKVDFKVIDGTFRKTLIDLPAKIRKTGKDDFEFVMTPVDEIFFRIEEAYGVEIVFDRDLLAECKLSASLGEENMYEKINLICQGINATFQEVDTRIIINAQKGCE